MPGTEIQGWWGWALAMLFAGCISHDRPEPDAESASAARDGRATQSKIAESRAWDCPDRPADSGRSHECRGCFHLDENGVGECRIDPHRANEADFVAALRHGASSRDGCKAWDDAVAFPLGSMLVEMAQKDGFVRLDELKAAAAQPQRHGHPQLEGLLVRVNGGTSGRGEEWGGLIDLLYVGPRPDGYRTCCTEPGCMGTDFRCQLDAPGRLAWCEPVSAPGRRGILGPGAQGGTI